MKEILIAHIEKVALALCVLLMLYFLYSAFSIPKYDKTPDDFNKIARRARENVDNSKADVSDLKLPELDKIVASLHEDIDPEKIGFEKRWLRPFDFGLNFRREPTILTPGKPEVQLNRGLLRLFKTDINGKRIVQPGGGGGGGGAVGKADVKPLITEEDIVLLREMGFDPEESVFRGNEEMFEQIGGNVENLPEEKVEANPGRQRIDFTNRPRVVRAGNKVAAPDPKAPKAGPAAAPAGQELVVTMVGKEWVEVVAPFPHSEQIREYIKALREAASFVGLRYARVQVERRELDSSMEWTEWQRVPIKEQWEVIQNAVSWEEEPFPDVALKGLAMHIPELVSVDKNLLSSEEFDRPRPAEYTPAELNPEAVEKAKPARKNRRPAQPGATPRPANVLKEDIKSTGPAGVFDNHYQLSTAMIRVWDFTIVPGRRYQYQLRVVVYNPNFNRKDVAEAEFAEEKYLAGPWSEPSEEIYIEPGIQWFVDDKQSSLRGNRVNVEVHAWPRVVGEWITTSLLQGPGEIIGGIPSGPNIVEIWNEQLGQFERKNRDFSREYDTNQILLDVGGGSVTEEITVSGSRPERRNFRLPREVFAVNAYGDLIRRNEDDDRTDPDRIHHEERNQRMVNGGGPASDFGGNANPSDAGNLDPIKKFGQP